MRLIIIIMISNLLISSYFPENYELRTFYDESQLKRTTIGLSSNGIIDIMLYETDKLIIGSAGLGFGTKDEDMNWQFYSFEDTNLPDGGNPAIAVNDEVIVVAGAIGVEIGSATEQKGTGISFSIDGGETWIYTEQPTDICEDGSTSCSNIDLIWGENTVQQLAITVAISNVTYDLDIHGDYIYAASWAGGIRRLNFKESPDVWQVIALPMDQDLSMNYNNPNYDWDSYELNPREPADGGNNNHKGFSVFVDEDTLWVGTANGINKGIIEEEFINWERHYTYLDGISGNWVVGFTKQTKLFNEDIHRIWAITWSVSAPEQNSLSYSDDFGASWESVDFFRQQDFKVYQIYSQDEWVFAATDGGLYISKDGVYWEKLDRPINQIDGSQILSDFYLSVFYNSDLGLWVGTNDGLAQVNFPNQSNWNIYQYWPDQSDEKFYAFPNPFDLDSDRIFDNDGHVRFKFISYSNQCEIQIFDFSMNPIISLSNCSQKDGEFGTAIWNGRNELGSQVSNGMYFCRLLIDGDYYWTKLLVLR